MTHSGSKSNSISSTVLYSSELDSVVSEGHTIPIKHTIFGDALTPELVGQAITQRAGLILARTGGDACHGAVYFLSASRLGLTDSICVVGFGDAAWRQLRDDLSLTQILGETVLFLDDRNEEIQFASRAPSRQLVQRKFSVTNEYDVCYLPERRMNDIEYGLRHPACVLSLNSLGYPDASSYLDSSGRAWYRNAPTVSEIRALAADIDQGSAILEKNINSYDCLLRKLEVFDLDFLHCGQKNVRIDKALDRLISAAHQYYSNFFFLHDTYYHVLAYCINLSGQRSSRHGILLRNRLLSASLVVEDFTKRGEFPRKAKGAFADDPVTTLPMMSLEDEVKAATDQIFDWLRAQLPSMLSNSTAYDRRFLEFLTYSIGFIVAKERKFLLNKCIYSRIAEVLKMSSRQNVCGPSNVNLLECGAFSGVLKEALERASHV